jgi:hypothetical protein
MPKVGVPVTGQTQYLQLWETYNHQHLSAGHQKLAVTRPLNRECTPKPASFEFLELAVYHQDIPQLGRATIVDLGPHYYSTITVIEHFTNWVSQPLGQQRPIRLDESQISDVMHKTVSSGIEKHNANFCV